MHDDTWINGLGISTMNHWLMNEAWINGLEFEWKYEWNVNETKHESLDKALDQMTHQTCRHVNPMVNLMDDFHEQKHTWWLMIHDIVAKNHTPMNWGLKQPKEKKSSP